MRTPAPLPPHLHQQLDSALESIFEQAWDALGGVDVEESILESARACLAPAARRKHEARAHAARLANDRCSLMSGLPNELWGLVFEHMSFDDFFVATQVCTAWRARAFAIPHLWARPSFHIYYDCGRGTVNVDTPLAVLARSGAVPLDVTLADYDTLRLGKRVVALVDALHPHSARITRLCMRTDVTDVPDFVLERLVTLSALKTLVVQRQPTLQTGYHLTFPFCTDEFGFKLPKLMHLELGAGYIWPANFPCTIPTIRSLHLTPRQALDTEIGAALQGCPNLSRLHLDLSVFTNMQEPRLVDAILRGRAASVVCVTIAGLASNIFLTDWAMATFHDPGRREFAVDIDASNSLGWDVLRDVFTPGAAIQLTLEYSRGNVLTARASGESGRIRSVAMHNCDEPSAPLSALAQVVAGAGADCKWTVKPDESCASRFVLPSQ